MKVACCVWREGKAVRPYLSLLKGLKFEKKIKNSDVNYFVDGESKLFNATEIASKDELLLIQDTPELDTMIKIESHYRSKFIGKCITHCTLNIFTIIFSFVLIAESWSSGFTLVFFVAIFCIVIALWFNQETSKFF